MLLKIKVSDNYGNSEGEIKDWILRAKMTLTTETKFKALSEEQIGVSQNCNSLKLSLLH